VLFSEPKIPQCSSISLTSSGSAEFQCSSASRKFLNSETKLPQSRSSRVSVLFSEPKIPQSNTRNAAVPVTVRFSALQRAENSSIHINNAARLRIEWFQCSSASRKFLNKREAGVVTLRARVSVLFSEPKIPQCFAPHDVPVPPT